MGGDAQIVFKWFVLDKNGSETSILEENYQFNLNDIEFKVGFERNYIRFKIKKREEQNKFNTRKDTTVDLFSDTNLDNNSITPVQTDNIYFKKINNIFTNKWTAIGDQESYNRYDSSLPFFSNSRLTPVASVLEDNFIRSYSNAVQPNKVLFIAENAYQNVSLKILSLRIQLRQDPTNSTLVNNFKLVGYINNINNTFFEVDSIVFDTGSYLITEIDIINEIFDVPNLNISDKLNITAVLDDDRLPNSEYLIETNFEYQLSQSVPEFAVETKSVRLFDSISQICKQYTDNNILLNSSILSLNGRYYDNYINSFLGLRANEKNNIEQTLKTNFESLFENGVSKIMSLGYDLTSEELKIEDINFFFKDIEIFDLTNRDFERDSFLLNQYNEIHCNTLLTGYKKFSSEQNEDLFNFNTKVELTTPIKSLKKKLDIESETTTDGYAINEGINDVSNSTNDKDDDIVIINSVDLNNYVDEAYYNSVTHINDSNDLILEQFDRSWTIDIVNGQSIEIKTGLNVGSYIVQNVTPTQLNLGFLSIIETGTSSNIIEITRENIIKNRTSEGFDVLTGVNDPETSLNVIHNPIYQLFRWYPLWGSGLTKKELNTEIIVNDYKNNGGVSVKVNTTEFPDEYPNQITLDQNFTQTDLQNVGLFPLFNGNHIEVKIYNVDFFEFFEIFNNWRYGFNNDDNTSFGYLTVPTPYGNKKIFPFGDEAFNHKRSENTLTIKGLEKHES